MDKQLAEFISDLSGENPDVHDDYCGRGMSRTTHAIELPGDCDTPFDSLMAKAFGELLYVFECTEPEAYVKLQELAENYGHDITHIHKELRNTYFRSDNLGRGSIHY
jgi:hypothetical protein